MKLYSDMKLRGDAYAGGFSCGLTMANSRTIQGMQVVEDTIGEWDWNALAGGRIVLENENRIRMTTVASPIHAGDDTAVELTTTVFNGSKQPIVIDMLTSFAVRQIEADRVHRLQSFWSAEGKLRTESIADLHIEPSWNRCGLRIEKFGNVGSMPVRKFFPFLALENSATGAVIGVNIYCASSWQMEILCKEDDRLAMTGGLADRDFGQWSKTLQPGEQFTAPKAVVAVGQSLYEVTDRLVRAQKPLCSEVDDHMGILFNEYCTTWGNPSFENMKKICDKIADKGIQFLVIDSGWYGKSDGWWNSIGDWVVNEERFPGGMKPIADYVRSKGMIPGLWYEMEAVAPGSIYFNDVEHLICKDGVPLTVGDRRFWDMENEWVIDFLSDRVIRLLKECGYGYLKVDYNDSLGMGCDDPDGLGEGLRKKILASQAFFDRIRREIPGIVIENCSSGGHRLEPSMMELCSQASFSDAHETKAIPIIAANMHRVIQPRQSQIWAVMRAEDSDERIGYSLISTMFGRMCLSGDIYNLSEHQWALVEEGMDFYRMAAPIIQNGRTICQEYQTKLYNEPVGDQLVIREYQNKKLVILHRFANSTQRDLSNILDGHIVNTYGNAHCDFSAQAWIVEK